jgi:hypothetical protein
VITLETWLIIVLLGLGIIVYARMFFTNDTTPEREKLIEEMEDTIEHFAMEIETENKQLMDYLLKIKQQSEEQSSKLSGRIEYLEKQLMDSTIQYKNVLEKTTAVHEAIQSTPGIKPKTVENPETSLPNKEPLPDTKKLEIKERYLDLFRLHDQGKSMEYISKKLSMNKGEVQLILQLAKQEEQSSV